MASYFEQLEGARSALSLGDDLRELLMVVAKNPDQASSQELTSFFANHVGVSIDTVQAMQLAAIIKAANPEPVAEPEPEPTSEAEPTPEPVAEVEEEDFDFDEEPTEVEPVATTEVAVEVPVTAAALEEDEPGLDAADYTKIDLASSHEIASLKVTTNDVGLFEVSWPKAKDAVFVVVAGEKRFPDAIESSADEVEVFKPTSKNEKTFSSQFRYISVFRFDEAGGTGYKIGQGRALGRLLKFEAEKYPGKIILSWQTDDPEASVVVFKSEPNQKLPKVPTSEPERKPADSFWNDVMVEVGESYEYRAHLEWR